MQMRNNQFAYLATQYGKARGCVHIGHTCKQERYIRVIILRLSTRYSVSDQVHTYFFLRVNVVFLGTEFKSLNAGLPHTLDW